MRRQWKVESRPIGLYWIGTLLVLACFLVSSERMADARKPGPFRILVLSSHQAAPFKQATRGFKDYLQSKGIPAALEIVTLDGNRGTAAQSLQKAKQEGMHLVFTLGSVAAKAAREEAGATPIIAGLVLNPDDIRGRSDMTGVHIEVPLEVQLKWIKQILPESRRVGLVFNANKSFQRINAAAAIARDMGLALQSRPVSNPSDIPQALESLSREADVLWGVPDDLVYAAQTAKSILLFSFRNRIPLVGLSGEWVNAGALFALEWDYRDLGAQCAEMALEVLNGTPAGSIPVASPRKLTYRLNAKTALHMKVDLPESLINNAAQVFK